MKRFFSGLALFAACFFVAFQALAADASPKYATPGAALAALASACERKSDGYDSFKYPANVVALSDILSSRSQLASRPAAPTFAFNDSAFFQNQFFQGAQNGNIAHYNFPADYIKYPWQADALRKANLAAIGKDSFIARVTNDKGQSAWLVLRDHTPSSWRIVAIAESEDQARYLAQDAFWNAYVAAKAAQLREWAEKYDARQALAAKLYSEVQLKETSFETTARPNGDQVLKFILTIANNSDYVLDYADGVLRLKDQSGQYNFGASFSTKEAKNPVFAHSSAPYDVVIVFSGLKEAGGADLVAHYRAGLSLLKIGKIPYEATLSVAKMVQGDESLLITRSGAAPRQSRNPDERPDYEFSNKEDAAPADDVR